MKADFINVAKLNRLQDGEGPKRKMFKSTMLIDTSKTLKFVYKILSQKARRLEIKPFSRCFEFRIYLHTFYCKRNVTSFAVLLSLTIQKNILVRIFFEWSEWRISTSATFFLILHSAHTLRTEMCNHDSIILDKIRVVMDMKQNSISPQRLVAMIRYFV